MKQKTKKYGFCVKIRISIYLFFCKERKKQQPYSLLFGSCAYNNVICCLLFNYQAKIMFFSQQQLKGRGWVCVCLEGAHLP